MKPETGDVLRLAHLLFQHTETVANLKEEILRLELEIDSLVGREIDPEAQALDAQRAQEQIRVADAAWAAKQLVVPPQPKKKRR